MRQDRFQLIPQGHPVGLGPARNRVRINSNKVVTIKQEAAKSNTDQDEGFGSVAETEQFVEGDVAVDEQRNDPIIKAKLEAAKEEFIENKYNQ